MFAMPAQGVVVPVKAFHWVAGELRKLIGVVSELREQVDELKRAKPCHAAVIRLADALPEPGYVRCDEQELAKDYEAELAFLEEIRTAAVRAVEKRVEVPHVQ